MLVLPRKRRSLRSYIKVHRIGVLAPSADVDVGQAPKHEIVLRKSGHKLIRSYEDCELGCTVPEDDSIGAEIATVDGHSERDAVDWYAVWRQRRYRGWRKQRADTTWIMICPAHSASEGKQACEHKTDAPHNYVLSRLRKIPMGAGEIRVGESVFARRACQDERVCN